MEIKRYYNGENQIDHRYTIPIDYDTNLFLDVNFNNTKEILGHKAFNHLNKYGLKLRRVEEYKNINTSKEYTKNVTLGIYENDELIKLMNNGEFNSMIDTIRFVLWNYSK